MANDNVFNNKEIRYGFFRLKILYLEKIKPSERTAKSSDKNMPAFCHSDIKNERYRFDKTTMGLVIMLEKTIVKKLRKDFAPRKYPVGSSVIKTVIRL